MQILIAFGKWLLGWLTNGALDKALAIVDRKIDSETEKERIKADLVVAHLNTRAAYMRAGGFWLMLAFAAPLALWWSAVLVYSVLWCQGCAYPQDWSVAALPPPLDEWAGWIVISIFGVLTVDRLKR